MKLRKTIIGTVIWGVYAGFIAVTLYLSLVLSGLTGQSTVIAVAVGITAAILVGVTILSIPMGMIADRIKINSETAVILELIAATLILGGAVCVRVIPIILGTYSVTGDVTLLDGGLVGANGRLELTSFVYSLLTWMISLATGNNNLSAYILQIIFHMIVVFCMYFSMRMAAGPMYAVFTGAYLSFFPYFTDRTGELGTQTLIMACFSLEMFLMILMLRGIFDGHWSGLKRILLCYVLNGISIGFLTYMDTGAVLIFPVLILIIFFIRGLANKVKMPWLPVIMCVLFAAACLFMILVQEGGIAFITDTLEGFAARFMGGSGDFVLLARDTEYALLYVITLAVMFLAVPGYKRDRDNDRISPYLLMVILVSLVGPYIELSGMSTGYAVTVFYGIAVGCALGSVLTPREQIMMLSNTEIGSAVQAMPSVEDEINKENDSPESEAAPDGRYVPEGMVLPTGDEASERDNTPRMNMKSLENTGMIGLDRGAAPAVDNKPEPAPKPAPVVKREPEPAPKPAPVEKSAPAPEIKPEPKPEPRPAPAPRSVPVQKAAPAEEDRPAPKPAVKPVPEVKSEPVREVRPEPVPAPVPQSAPIQVQAPDTEPEQIYKLDPLPERVYKLDPVPAEDPSTESEMPAAHRRYKDDFDLDLKEGDDFDL